MGDVAAHSVLSPSSSKRWLACTPSARFEQQFPNTESDAAAEGTLAHALAEISLKLLTNKIQHSLYEIKRETLLKEDAGKFHSPEMDAYVAGYVNYVYEQFSSSIGTAEVLIEQKIDISDFIPECSGILDAAVFNKVFLYINDLKYGKGVEVSAIENTQLMAYAAGLIKSKNLTPDVVVLNIYQPRMNNISQWCISVADLNKWVTETLVPKAEEAFMGDGEFTPGDHCLFCRARNVCRANADFMLQDLLNDFMDPIAEDGLADLAKPHTLTPDEISVILLKAPSVIKWLNSVQEYALTQALAAGVEWPGFKLVNGRTKRVITDPAYVADYLEMDGYPEDAYFNKDLKSLTDLQKLVGGQKKFDELFKNQISKSAGKPTLVPVEDKREVFNSALTDFSDEINFE